MKTNWLLEWCESAPTDDDPCREFRLRVFWAPRTSMSRTRKNRRLIDAFVVKMARPKRWYSKQDPFRRGTMTVWTVEAWISRLDVEKAAERGIYVRLLTEARWPKHAAFQPWNPKKCAEILVRLDEWLAQGLTRELCRRHVDCDCMACRPFTS